LPRNASTRRSGRNRRTCACAAARSGNDGHPPQLRQARNPRPMKASRTSWRGR
jgi:hypothetical protein